VEGFYLWLFHLFGESNDLGFWGYLLNLSFYCFRKIFELLSLNLVGTYLLSLLSLNSSSFCLNQLLSLFWMLTLGLLFSFEFLVIF